MLVPDHSCIPRLSLPRGAARADDAAAVGKVPEGQTCTPSVCLDFLHMAVRVEGSPLERGAPPASTTSPDTASRFWTEATFPQGGTGLGLGGQSQVGSPSPQAVGGRECARACVLALQPSVAPTTCVPRGGGGQSTRPEGGCPPELALGTATGSRAEAGRGATSRAPANPRTPSGPPARLGLPSPPPGPGDRALTATACPASC